MKSCLLAVAALAMGVSGAPTLPALVVQKLAAMADSHGFVPSVCVTAECKHLKGIVADKKGTVVHKSIITSPRALRAYYTGPAGTRLTILRENGATQLDTLGATPMAQNNNQVLEIIECFEPGRYIWFVYGTQEQTQGPFHLWLSRNERMDECGKIKVTSEGNDDIAPMTVYGPEKEKPKAPAAAPAPPANPQTPPVVESTTEPDGSEIPAGVVDLSKAQAHVAENPIIHPSDPVPMPEIPAVDKNGPPLLETKPMLQQAAFYAPPPPEFSVMDTSAQPAYINGQPYYPVVNQAQQQPMYPPTLPQVQPQPQVIPSRTPQISQEPPAKLHAQGFFYLPNTKPSAPARNPLPAAPASAKKPQQQEKIPTGVFDMGKIPTNKKPQAVAEIGHDVGIPIGVVDLSKLPVIGQDSSNQNNVPVIVAPVQDQHGNTIQVGIVDLSTLPASVVSPSDDTVEDHGSVEVIEGNGDITDMQGVDVVEDEDDVEADPLDVVVEDDASDEQIDQILGGSVEIVSVSVAAPAATSLSPTPAPHTKPSKAIAAQSGDVKEIQITATVVREDERYAKLKIAVIVIGALALVLCAVAMVGCCCFVRNRHQKANQVDAAVALPKMFKPKKGKAKPLPTSSVESAPAWCLTPQLKKKAEADGVTGLSQQAGLDIMAGEEDQPASSPYSYPAAMLNKVSDCPPAYPLSPDSTSSDNEDAFKERTKAIRRTSKPVASRPRTESTSKWASIDLETTDDTAGLMRHDQLRRSNTEIKRGNRLQVI